MITSYCRESATLKHTLLNFIIWKSKPMQNYVRGGTGIQYSILPSHYGIPSTSTYCMCILEGKDVSIIYIFFVFHVSNPVFRECIAEYYFVDL